MEDADDVRTRRVSKAPIAMTAAGGQAPWAGPVLALGLATLATLATLHQANPGGRLRDDSLGLAGGRSERHIEAFVEAWANNDVEILRRLSTAAVARRLSNDQRFRWPTTTPATDGPRIQLGQALDRDEGGVEFVGRLRFGETRPRLRIGLAGPNGGHLIDSLAWD